MTAETGFVPKYQKIINELHAMLRQGVLKPGDKLPSREELVERYGVTRATVNRAAQFLLHVRTPFPARARRKTPDSQRDGCPAFA